VGNPPSQQAGKAVQATGAPLAAYSGGKRSRNGFRSGSAKYLHCGHRARHRPLRFFDIDDGRPVGRMETVRLMTNCGRADLSVLPGDHHDVTRPASSSVLGRAFGRGADIVCSTHPQLRCRRVSHLGRRFGAWANPVIVELNRFRPVRCRMFRSTPWG